MDKSLLPDKVESLWTATTSETNFPQLINDIETDVAIVGGGIAGLNAAYFLKQKGLKVIVVESTYIVSGTSGNTTSKFTSQHKLKYNFLVNSIGEDKARLYADSNQWAISEFEKIIKKENINCDFYRLPAYVYTRKKEGVNEIKQEAEVAKSLDLPASYVTFLDNVPFKIEGAIKFDNQAYFHPRNFLLPIADKINNNGSYVFEKTTATDLKEKENGCEVTTETGKVRSKFVIVATNLPFYNQGAFAGQVHQILSYVLATRVKSPIPQGMYIGTDESDMSFRPHVSGNDQWLLIGGVHHNVGESSNTDLDYQQLEERARKFFKIDSIDFKWGAQDTYAEDRVPYIGFMPESKRILVTTGYSAWGMTTSFVSAQLLTDLITGEKNEWESLYSPLRIKKEDDKKMIKSDRGGDNMDVKPNEGKIINKDGKQLAVYKDESGKTTVLSAICTHQGCTVGWNSKDKTWDCPCHGSRYTKEGKVMHGPAVKDLPRHS